MGRYIVWCPNIGQSQKDGVKVTAADPGAAAQEWVEWYTASNTAFIGGNDATVIVMVLEIGTGEQREWIVSGENVRAL